MKVIILGGTKFIGRAIANAFVNDGHSVTLFTRGLAKPTGVLHHNHIYGDRNNLDDLRRASTQGWDVIVDNIGTDRRSMELALEAFRGQLQKRSHFFFTSSASVYALLNNQTQPVKEPATDSSFLMRSEKPISLLHSLGQNKLEAERLLTLSPNINFTIFRPHRVVGPGHLENHAFWYMARLLSGGPILLSDGGVRNLQFTFVNDLAKAYVLAAKITKSNRRTYNIAQRETTSLSDFINESALNLGIKPDYVPAPSRWLGSLGGPFTKITSTFLDVSRATKELGLKPSPFKNFIRITAQWFRDYPLHESDLKLLLSNRKTEIHLCRLLCFARKLPLIPRG